MNFVSDSTQAIALLLVQAQLEGRPHPTETVDRELLMAVTPGDLDRLWAECRATPTLGVFADPAVSKPAQALWNAS
jgi:hypothetical protein